MSDALAASPSRLAKALGRGPAKRLLSFKALCAAVLAERIRARPWISLEEMASFANLQIGYSPIERAYVFYIDAGGCIIHSEVAAEGTTTSTLVDVRSIIVRAVDCGACALVLAHNHPSGDLRPSITDVNLTQRLRRMAQDFDMRLVDHIIVGRGRAYAIDQRRCLELPILDKPERRSRMPRSEHRHAC